MQQQGPGCQASSRQHRGAGGRWHSAQPAREWSPAGQRARRQEAPADRAARLPTLSILYLITDCGEWRFRIGAAVRLAVMEAKAGAACRWWPAEPRAIHPAANRAGTASRPTTPAQALCVGAWVSGCAGTAADGRSGSSGLPEAAVDACRRLTLPISTRSDGPRQMPRADSGAVRWQRPAGTEQPRWANIWTGWLGWLGRCGFSVDTRCTQQFTRALLGTSAAADAIFCW